MAQGKIIVNELSGRAIPIHGNDIDTDRIIPARFMKCVTFEGLGQYAFFDARFNEDGSPKNHPFNAEQYKGGEVLLVNKNFGCGSSREHAPQALQKYGVKAIIGESFAEIFAGNCNAMGIPVVKASEADINKMFQLVEADPGLTVTIKLEKGKILVGNDSFDLSMPSAYKNSLVSGTWDSMGVLLENLKEIKETAGRLPYANGYAS